MCRYAKAYHAGKLAFDAADARSGLAANAYIELSSGGQILRKYAFGAANGSMEMLARRTTQGAQGARSGKKRRASFDKRIAKPLDLY